MTCQIISMTTVLKALSDNSDILLTSVLAAADYLCFLWCSGSWCDSWILYYVLNILVIMSRDSWSCLIFFFFLTLAGYSCCSVLACSSWHIFVVGGSSNNLMLRNFWCFCTWLGSSHSVGAALTPAGAPWKDSSGWAACGIFSYKKTVPSSHVWVESTPRPCVHFGMSLAGVTSSVPALLSLD